MTGIPCEYRMIFAEHNYVFYKIEKTAILIIDIYNEKEDFMWKLFGIKTISDEIEDLFYYICIGGILLVVILSIIDLIKVVSGNSEDGLINFFKNLKARIITIIILLILPVIIPYILNLINSLAEITGYNSDNPLCLKK